MGLYSDLAPRECICLYGDFARTRVHVPIQYFDTCVGASIQRGVSFRDRPVYLSHHRIVMISPPNAAPCSEDTPRDNDRCQWHH